MAALAAALAVALERPGLQDEMLRGFGAEPTRALQQLAGWGVAGTFVLLVDQLEELLTLCRDAREQALFAQVLCALSEPAPTDTRLRCLLLLTLRTDHLAKLERHPALAALHARVSLEGNQRYIGGIGVADIRRAIQEPADAARLRFVPRRLIDQLAYETAALGNGLPLLQFTLLRLWDGRRRRDDQPMDAITSDDVARLSGLGDAARAGQAQPPVVASALSVVASEVFQAFSEARQRICERLLLELVVLDESFDEPLRRRRSRDELHAALAAQSADPRDVDYVIDTFKEKHLLRGFARAGGGEQIEVTHEALLRHWEHMARKLSETDVKARLHRVKELTREAEDWQREARRPDLLKLRGTELDQALQHQRERWITDPLTEAYVSACAQQAADARAAARRAGRLRRGLTIVAALALLLGGGAATWFWNSTRTQREQLDTALAAELASRALETSDARLKLLLGVESLARRPSSDAMEAVGAALDAPLMQTAGSFRVGDAGDAVLVRIVPGGRRVAVGRANGTVELFDLGQAARAAALLRPLATHALGARVTHLAFSGDGSHLAAAGSDGRVQVWPLDGPVDPAQAPSTRLAPGLSALALSGSGGTLAALRWDGRGELLELATARRSTFLVRDPLAAIAFAAADGEAPLVAQALGCEVSVADLRLGDPPDGAATCGPGASVPLSFALSPDGAWIARSGRETVNLGQVVGRGGGGEGVLWLSGPTNRAAVSLTFSGRGRFLAGLAPDRHEGFVLDRNGNERVSVRSERSLQDLTVSDDGHLLLGVTDGRVIGWEIVNPASLETVLHAEPHPDRQPSAAQDTQDVASVVAPGRGTPSGVAMRARTAALSGALPATGTPLATFGTAPAQRFVVSGITGDTSLAVRPTAENGRVQRYPIQGGRIETPGLRASPSGRVVGAVTSEARASGPTADAPALRILVWNASDDGLLGRPCRTEPLPATRVRGLQLADAGGVAAVLLDDPVDPAAEAAVAPKRPKPTLLVLAQVPRGDGSCQLVIQKDMGPMRTDVFALSPDGRWLAYAAPDDSRALQLWDVKERRPAPVADRAQRAHLQPIAALAFSGDSALLASGARDRSIRLWLLDPHGLTPAPGDAMMRTEGAVAALHIAAGDVAGEYRLACAHERGVCLKRLQLSKPEEGSGVIVKQQLERTMELKSGEMPRSLVFSPDARRLAALDSGNVRAWDVADLHEVFRRRLPDTPTNAVLQVIFLDPRRIETLTLGGEGSIWGVDPGGLLNTVLAFLDRRPDLVLTDTEWRDKAADPDGTYGPRLVRRVPDPPDSDRSDPAPLADEALRKARRDKVMQALRAHAKEARSVADSATLPEGHDPVARWAQFEAMARQLPQLPGATGGASAPDPGKAARLADELQRLMHDIERSERDPEAPPAVAVYRRLDLCTQCATCHEADKSRLACPN